MAKEKRSFESALASILEELDLSFSLKVEQEYALKSFISKKDVFGWLFPSLWLRHLALIGRSTNLLRAEAVWKTILLPPLGSAILMF